MHECVLFFFSNFAMDSDGNIAFECNVFWKQYSSVSMDKNLI